MRIKIFEKLGSCKHNDSKFRRIVGIKRGCPKAASFYIDNVLLQSKHYRHRIFNAYRFTALHTRFPFRHGTNHTKCFFIQIRVNTSYDFGIYNTTVLVNNELYCYTTLRTISWAIVGYLMFLLKNCIKPAIPPFGNSGICSTTSKWFVLPVLLLQQLQAHILLLLPYLFLLKRR